MRFNFKQLVDTESVPPTATNFCAIGTIWLLLFFVYCIVMGLAGCIFLGVLWSFFAFDNKVPVVFFAIFSTSYGWGTITLLASIIAISVTWHDRSL